MREPLNSFAERLVHGGELAEFLQGIVREYHISREAIMAMIPAESQHDELPYGPYGRGVSQTDR